MGLSTGFPPQGSPRANDPKEGEREQMRPEPWSVYNLISEVTSHCFCILGGSGLPELRRKYDRWEAILDTTYHMWSQLDYEPRTAHSISVPFCEQGSHVSFLSENRVREAIPASPPHTDLFSGSIRVQFLASQSIISWQC